MTTSRHFLKTASATTLAAESTTRDEALFIGIGFSVGMGTLKETHDLTVKNTCFSWKDLAWDLLGATAGATAAHAANRD
jgi:putative lipoprotein